MCDPPTLLYLHTVATKLSATYLQAEMGNMTTSGAKEINTKVQRKNGLFEVAGDGSEKYGAVQNNNVMVRVGFLDFHLRRWNWDYKEERLVKKPDGAVTSSVLVA